MPADSPTRYSPLGRVRALAERDTPVLLVLGRYAALSLGLVSAPVVARALGPHGRGLTATALALLTVIPVVLSCGVPLAVRRRSATSGSDDVVRTARRFAALTVVPSLVLVQPLTAWVVPGLTRADKVVFALSMAAVPLTVSWAVDANVLLVNGRYRRVAALGVIQAFVSTGLVVALAAAGRLEVWSVLVAFLAGNVVTFVAGRWWVRTPEGPVVGMRDLLREGRRLTGGQVGEVATGRLDQIMTLPLIGPQAAGWYSVGNTVGTLVSPVVQALGNSAFAELTSGGRADARRVLRQAIALATGAGAMVAVAAWALVPPVFGEAFAPSRPIALVAVAGAVVTSVTYVATMALAATDHGREMTMARVVGLLVGLALLPLGAWVAGGIGVAGAMALGAVAGLLHALRSLGLGPVEVIPRPGDYRSAVAHLVGRAAP